MFLLYCIKLFVYSKLRSITPVATTVHAFNKSQKKKKKKMHILTYGGMQGCGLTSLVVCINDKFVI